MAMETKRLGRTGMQVGRLGIGLSEVGFNLELTDVDQARSVINQAVSYTHLTLPTIYSV